jgi:hypothetical protein
MKTVMMKLADLRPHDLHQVLYGRPTQNPEYKNLREQMKQRGFDPRHPLLVTRDGRILAGVTRWAAAIAAGLTEAPCVVFTPSGEENAEPEYTLEILRDNMYRTKDEVMKAREQRAAKEAEAVLARKRMAQGARSGDVGKAASTSEARVGKLYKEAGRTVRRRIQVLDAIEKAEEAGDHKLAERMTDLLNSHKPGKALDLVQGKPKKPVVVKKVDVPRTLHDHATKAHSEFYEACCKAGIPEEVKILDGYLAKMHTALETARKRLSGAVED